jgi:hypothetical protein
MAKAKKQENGKQVQVTPQVMDATQRIKALCEKQSLTPTNKFAVLKDLKPDYGHEYRFTSWAKNSAGEKGLVVLNSGGTGIKFYQDPTAKFPGMKNV